MDRCRRFGCLILDPVDGLAGIYDAVPRHQGNITTIEQEMTMKP